MPVGGHKGASSGEGDLVELKLTCDTICSELKVAGNIIDEGSQLFHVIGREHSRPAGRTDADHAHHFGVDGGVGVL